MAEAGRKLKAQVQKRLAAELEEEIFDLLEDLEFYPAANDFYGGYKVMEFGEHKVIVSIKTAEKNLKRS